MHYLIRQDTTKECQVNPEVEKKRPVYAYYTSTHVISVTSLDPELTEDELLLNLLVVTKYRKLRHKTKDGFREDPKEIEGVEYFYLTKNPKAGQLTIDGLDYEPTYIKNEAEDPELVSFIEKVMLRGANEIAEDTNHEVVPEILLQKYRYFQNVRETYVRFV